MSVGRGFTLIELLVASTLAIMLLGLVVGALLHLSRLSARTGELLAMHELMAGVQRTLNERFASIHPGGAWHADASPGADGTWGTGDESLRLTWLGTVPFRDEVGYGFVRGEQIDLTWFRLEWRGPAHPQGAGLFFGRTRGERSNTDLGWFQWSDPVYPQVRYVFTTWPQPRRDRRRDLDDNDWRTVEGITAATYAHLSATIPGDGSDLAAQMSALLHQAYAISDFTCGWRDHAGRAVVFTPDTGLQRQDAAGSVIPFTMTAWDAPTRIVEDGLFLDARAHSLPGDGRDIAGARPALLRLGFTMEAPQPAGVTRARVPIRQHFALAIPLGSTLPAP